MHPVPPPDHREAGGGLAGDRAWSQREGRGGEELLGSGETALATARRELVGALRESVGVLEDVAPSSGIHRMVRLTAEELVALSRPWLILDFMAAGRSALTRAAMSELQRSMWGVRRGSRR